jgi:hypothetical protein
MTFLSNRVFHIKSRYSCQIMSFMSNHVIHLKSCHSSQIMTFMSFISNHVFHVIHVKSCHSCQIMSFMSNHVKSFMSCVIRTFQVKIHLRREEGGEGQICLPRPSATALLSCRRQKQLLWM